MKAWWLSRSRREQVLMGLLAFLLVTGVAWYGVWKPVMGFHAGASSRYMMAAREKQAVQTLAARIRAYGALPAPKFTQPLADAVRESLAVSAITPSRIELDLAGGVRVAINGVSPALLFDWIGRLQTAHGIAPRHLVVVKEGQGLLGMDATLGRESSR